MSHANTRLTVHGRQLLIDRSSEAPARSLMSQPNWACRVNAPIAGCADSARTAGGVGSVVSTTSLFTTNTGLGRGSNSRLAAQGTPRGGPTGIGGLAAGSGNFSASTGGLELADAVDDGSAAFHTARLEPWRQCRLHGVHVGRCERFGGGGCHQSHGARGGDERSNDTLGLTGAGAGRVGGHGELVGTVLQQLAQLLDEVHGVALDLEAERHERITLVHRDPRAAERRAGVGDLGRLSGPLCGHPRR